MLYISLEICANNKRIKLCGTMGVCFIILFITLTLIRDLQALYPCDAQDALILFL